MNTIQIKEICIQNYFQIRTKLRNSVFIGYEVIQAIDRSHHLRFVLFTLQFFVFWISFSARMQSRELMELYIFAVYIFSYPIFIFYTKGFYLYHLGRHTFYCFIQKRFQFNVKKLCITLCKQICFIIQYLCLQMRWKLSKEFS